MRCGSDTVLPHLPGKEAPRRGPRQNQIRVKVRATTPTSIFSFYCMSGQSRPEAELTAGRDGDRGADESPATRSWQQSLHEQHNTTKQIKPNCTLNKCSLYIDEYYYTKYILLWNNIRLNYLIKHTCISFLFLYYMYGVLAQTCFFCSWVFFSPGIHKD